MNVNRVAYVTDVSDMVATAEQQPSSARDGARRERAGSSGGEAAAIRRAAERGRPRLVSMSGHCALLC